MIVKTLVKTTRADGREMPRVLAPALARRKSSNVRVRTPTNILFLIDFYGQRNVNRATA
jgi:hypothetical protein